MVRVAIFLLALLWLAPAHAAAPYAFDTTPGQLPKTIVPRHYAIELTPDLQILRAAGVVTIDIDVREPVTELVLNALDLELGEAVADGTMPAAGIALDPAAQTVTLRFAQTLVPGMHRLRIVYTAKINSFGRGLFFTDYPAEGGQRRMFATHLEPADARRVFPGWDEPAFKATFATTLIVPASFLAVSNMPQSGESAAKPGLKRVSFATTPRISTYLFVAAGGEMERTSADVDGVTVGVVATAGKSAQSRYALDSAVRLLRYYNDYFGVRYPLPKLDLIALPGGFGGAMENWGGITFFEPLLLFDPQATPEATRRRIFAILAHEMAHQWFGDLVTMAWWDDLWLNEGFASWMESKASQALNPDWPVWLDGAGGKQWTMQQDAKATTHPIQQPVSDPSELLSVFDSITYGKGRAVIRQLEAYLGEDAFRAGIRAYMARHGYSNTTTADLWRAMQDASGKPVADIAASFTEQPGLPLIISEAACEGGRTRLTLSQDRFSLRAPAPLREPWSIPVAFAPVGGARSDVLLREMRATAEAGPCGSPIKLNSGDVGYYRVQYDGPTLAALTRDFQRLTPEDRINLLADTKALADAGRIPAAQFLAVADRVAENDRRAVWEEVIRAISNLDFLERGRPGRAALQAYALSRLRPVFDRLGWDPRPGESTDDDLLRPRLIRLLGVLGDVDIVAEARRRFLLFAADKSSLPPSLREPVLRVVGRGADSGTYDRMLALARQATAVEERSRLYGALAGALDPALAERTLRLALSDEIPSNLAIGLIRSVASNGEQAQLAWSFVKDNLDVLMARLGVTYRDNEAAYLLTNTTDPANAEELLHFAPMRKSAGGRIATDRAADTILTNAEVAARVLPAVGAWLAEHKR